MPIIEQDAAQCFELSNMHLVEDRTTRDEFVISLSYDSVMSELHILDDLNLRSMGKINYICLTSKKYAKR